MTATPTYRIEKDFQGERTLWVIKNRRGKVLSHHAESADAHRTVQRYIDEDRADAMEGR